MINVGHIRMVGLDLDCTLLTDDKRVTPRTEKAVTDAIAEGVIVLPATGRPVFGIPEVVSRIPGVRYLLGSNGAAVYDKENGEYIVHECMSLEQVYQAMELLKKADCALEVYIDGKPYASRESFERADYFVPDPYIRAYVRKTRIVVEDLNEVLMANRQGVEKINLCFPTVEAKQFGETLLSEMPQLKGVSGLPTNLEISKAGVDKGEGLILLGKKLGIGRREILACGDNENDLAMIQKTGFGAAMANALPKVKAIADYVLPYTNEEEGVAWLLEEIVKQRREQKH